jgi:citrate synthase
MRGVASSVCYTSRVDPFSGLIIRGIPIANLTDKIPEEMLWLLLTGELPSDAELAVFQKDLRSNGQVPDYIWKVLEATAPDSHAVAMLSTAIVAMERESTFRRRYVAGMSKDEFWEATLDDALRLIAVLPEMAAGLYRHRYNKGDRVAPDPNLDWAGNYAHMLGLPDPDGEFKDLMRLYLTLHCDHGGGNVSANTCRTVASALSDIYYAASAGLNGLAGQLHGLANQECLRFVLQLREHYGRAPTEEEIKEYAWEWLNSGRVIPGYGHAVLRVTDPRFTAFRDFAKRVFLNDDEVCQIVDRLAVVVPDVLREHGKAKSPWPNTDAGSGALLYHYGLTEFDYYTVIFGISRAMGMLSQVVIDRALGAPITRPKSVRTEWVKEQVGWSKSDATVSSGLSRDVPDVPERSLEAATAGGGTKIDVPYGSGTTPIVIDESHLAGIVRPNDVDTSDETETLTRALAAPLGPASLEEFLAGDGDVAVIVNDAARPTPTAKVLELIGPQLDKVRKLRFVIATGSHRAPTPEEFRRMFGDLLEKYQDRIVTHDARRADDMDYFGVSPRGTDVYVNRSVTDAAKILIIGSVEPHYFAGYTGGRKSLVPGVAGYRTIEQNHAHAMSPESRLAVLDGNPVHEDMVDAVRCLGERNIFSIMTVLDGQHRIYAATAGDIDDSFRAAVDKANDVYSVTIEGQADIVVAVARYPLDADLYQSHKAIETGKLALKDGGILILVAECRSGVGMDGFVRLLSSAQTPEEVKATLGGGYRLGNHKAAKLAELAMRAEMWAVSEADPNTLRNVFITPWPGLQEAVDAAITRQGEGARVLFLMDASVTVPCIV